MSQRVSISPRSSVVGKFSEAKPMAAEPVKFVTVAVLPPRLPSGMAPPSGLGPADTFGWDEAVSWRHNELIGDPKRKKSFLNKMGLTTEREKANDKPPFIKRQVTYEQWKMHYAKDAQGYYQGTHIPAEDCLLKDEDVAKWREEPAKVKGDMYTRGPIHLTEFDENPFRRPSRHGSNASGHDPAYHNTPVNQSPAQLHHTIADGKTAAQIIEEAKTKVKPSKKEQWKAAAKNGANFVLLST